eukprot:m.345291 g.345291  ORF g.345291 m.345291 type:complete len:823 (+) comp20662_c0_seq1:229-2697(+)
MEITSPCTIKAMEALSSLRCALDEPDLFPRVNLTALLEEGGGNYGSLAPSHTSKLTSIFTDVGLSASVGVNPGTQAITVSVKLPTPAEIQFLSANQVGTSRSQLALVVWTLLGIHPQQEQLETLHATNSDIPVANSCLLKLSEESHIAVTEKRVHFPLQTIILTVESSRRRITNRATGEKCTDSRTPLFSYSSLYHNLSGFDPSTSTFSKQTLDCQVDKVSSVLLSNFWSYITVHCNYIPFDELQEVVSVALETYVRSSIYPKQNTVKHGAVFQPCASFGSLYLYGTAGSGKSAFVTAMREALQTQIVERIGARQTVQVVKLPLNAMSPVSLEKELFVRGISDYSVERLIEQHVAKNRVVILHAEEYPSDPDHQDAFFHLLQDVQRKIASRYREYKHNIILVVTSNYLPAPTIDVRMVEMIPLQAAQQQHVCQQKLCSALNTAGGVLEAQHVDEHTGMMSALQVTIDVQLHARPPYTQDNRRLERWVTSVQYAITMWLRRAFRLRHTNTVGVGADNVAVVPVCECLTIDIFPDGAGGFGMTASVRSAECSTDWLSPLHMTSADGFFYYSSVCATQGSDAIPEYCFGNDESSRSIVNARASWSTLPEASRSMLETVLSMVETNFLKPGVLVLRGALRHCNAVSAIISTAVDILYAGRSAKRSLTVLTDADQEHIIGTAWDYPRGGLLKFIDDINNPAGAARRQHHQHYGFIFATVSAVGQFHLRELLEGNASATHRQLVRKDGIMFVLTVAHEHNESLDAQGDDDNDSCIASRESTPPPPSIVSGTTVSEHIGCGVTSTILSRAHAVIDCDSIILPHDGTPVQ